MLFTKVSLDEVFTNFLRYSLDIMHLIFRDKRVDLAKKQTARSVYRCHVIGPRGAGKTTFCQGLLGKVQEVD